MTPDKNAAGEAATSPTAEQVAKLHAMLKSIQESKGYYFNRDTELVMSLLEQLLAIKAKEGHTTDV